MTDTNNTPDTYGGGKERRKGFSMPVSVPPVPTFTDEHTDRANIIDDSNKVIDQLKTDLSRHVATVKQPTPTTTPLKEIAMRIKKLVHDDGEQFGDELKAKIGTDGVSIAKALQLWADDTLREKEKSQG